MVSPAQFTQKILTWYDQFGRHDLPWQKKQTPYRVWISEIMLQQTQVSAVIPYYQKFMCRFPNVAALAKASIDEVLHHWSGLGYYARARNLHRAAHVIQNQFNGQFPRTIAELEQLPGIGRSTAGAILSLAENIPAAILDGNVKRVLARCFSVLGSPSKTETAKQLWQLAEKYTPNHRCRDYNQAMMDIGALICTRTKPKCSQCPLEKNCSAHAANTEESFPQKKTSVLKPSKHTYMLILKNTKTEFLLIKRPNGGIWGGLWSFPEYSTADQLALLCKTHFQCELISEQALPPIKHIFSHYTLYITPLVLMVKASRNLVMDTRAQVWYNLQQALPGGIPTPVAKILKKQLGII